MTVLYNPDEGLEQVAEGLKRVAFDAIPGLNGFDYPHSDPPLPAAIVVPPTIDYRGAMRVGTILLTFELHLYVGSSAGHEQQKSLWEYLNWGGPSSILALIDADPSLGIVGTDGEPRVHAHVSSARPLGLEELPASAAFGAALQTLVIVTNKE